MSEIHVVKSKQTYAGIAQTHGFGDWRQIHEHPANAKLGAARPDPRLLHPGDQVYIPDRVAKTYSVSTDQKHTVQVRVAPEEGEPLLRSVTILVHGVNTTAPWYALIEGEIDEHQDGIFVGDDGLEHNIRYGVIPFSWGDYSSQYQGGNPIYAVDEVRQMFQNSWAPLDDRIYQGHGAVRLKELIDKVRELGAVQINVIAHSNGTALTCGALMLGASLDNVIFMGSPLDADANRTQTEIQRSVARITGKLYNFWSSGDEWAFFKGGIGADGNNATFRARNPSVVGVQFYRGAVIQGLRITERETDHGDYMLAEHMPIYSAYLREWGDAATPVPYDEAKLAELREFANWQNVSYYQQKRNITLNDPEMQAYAAQIRAILE